MIGSDERVKLAAKALGPLLGSIGAIQHLPDELFDIRFDDPHEAFDRFAALDVGGDVRQIFGLDVAVKDFVRPDGDVDSMLATPKAGILADTDLLFFGIPLVKKVAELFEEFYRTFLGTISALADIDKS